MGLELWSSRLSYHLQHWHSISASIGAPAAPLLFQLHVNMPNKAAAEDPCTGIPANLMGDPTLGEDGLEKRRIGERERERE